MLVLICCAVVASWALSNVGLRDRYQRYFRRLSGKCPICEGEVRMMMQSLVGVMTLLMLCPACRKLVRMTHQGAQLNDKFISSKPPRLPSEI